jgi:nucleoside diphosphate kinase
MKSFVGLIFAVLTASTDSFAITTTGTSNTRSQLRMASSSSATERTYIMIKPDGVQRGIVGNIISRFETKGYKMVAMKTRMATKEILDEHYKDLVKKPFFPKLREYLLSGPVVSMCWEGKEAGKYCTVLYCTVLDTASSATLQFALFRNEKHLTHSRQNQN